MYSFNNPRPQEFSLPFNLICYISDNPNAIPKLQKTCKKFFSKRRVIVLKHEFISKLTHSTGWKVKLWLNGNVGFWMYPLNNFCPKIYRSDISLLKFYYMSVSIDEYHLLTSSPNLQELYILESRVFSDDENDIPFYLLFENISGLKIFNCSKPIRGIPEIITNDTIKKWKNISDNNVLNGFLLHNFGVSSSLDPYLLFSFIKRTAAPKASFEFYFNYSFEGQQKLFEETIKEELVKWNGKILPYKKPFIQIRFL